MHRKLGTGEISAIFSGHMFFVSPSVELTHLTPFFARPLAASGRDVTLALGLVFQYSILSAYFLFCVNQHIFVNV